MPIVQQGAINTTALIVPDLYVQIVPPQTILLNGVPSNVIGVVGTASWGPVNVPTIISSMASYAVNFGQLIARKYDVGTQVATAVMQGASAFIVVRASDGSDVAAAASFNGATMANCSAIVTSRYTGSGANLDTLTIQAGSGAATYKAIVARPGLTPEVFDNIPDVVGLTFWNSLVSAVNNGIGPLRGPSQLISLAIGAGANETSNVTSLTLPMTVTLGTSPGATSGTDGVASATTATLIGQDSVPRKGMYTLRGQGCSIGVLADADDSTQWTTQLQFGLSEGLYMMLVMPSDPSLNIISAITALQTAGINGYSSKMLFGDWLWWNDQVNAVTRLVSPQGFAAGRLGNLSPEQSSLNKQLYGIVGSTKSGMVQSGQRGVYAAADLQALIGAGIDVITNPQPGGNYWGVRAGHNSSSNAAVNGDNYTRMTNYIAATLAAGMGIYVGEGITLDLFNNVTATLSSFLHNMLNQGMLTSLDGNLPFSVVCALSNNPITRTGLGYVQADVQVQYMAINEKFIVNMEGGQTVTVTRQNLPGS